MRQIFDITYVFKLAFADHEKQLDLIVAVKHCYLDDEAVIAAIYLDGGYEKAKAFVLEHGNLHFDVQSGNPIGDLKEFLDKMGEREPEEQWQKTGADNFPLFHCVLTALGETARGDGKTKREAKATAATRLLFELQRKYPPKESKKSKRK